MDKGKDNYISTVKAIGIILVVVGHSIDECFAHRVIYIFHMPLFFFCSGYFYKVPSSIENVKQYIQKRVRGLYFPFVKWSVLFMLLHNLFYTWNFYPKEDDFYKCYISSDYASHLKSILFTMTGQEFFLVPLWFLKELLLASVFVCLFTFILRKVSYMFKDIVMWCFLFVMAIISKPNEWGLPIIWNLSIMYLSATFFFAGYMYRMVERERFYSLSRLSFCLIILFIVVWYWKDTPNMLGYTADSIPLFVLMALIGILSVFAASYLIELSSIKYFFYYIGSHTMIVLVFHLLAFKVVSLLKIYIYGLPIENLSKWTIQDHNELFWLVYSLVGIGLPLLIYEIGNRLRAYVVGIKRKYIL